MSKVKINQDGFVVAHVHGFSSEDTVIDAPPENLIKPQIINGSWTEGATDAELEKRSAREDRKLEKTAKVHLEKIIEAARKNAIQSLIDAELEKLGKTEDELLQDLKTASNQKEIDAIVSDSIAALKN